MDVFPNKKKSRIVAFIIDETIVQIGDIDAWLWVAIEPIHNRILGVSISRHRNMLVDESFLRSLIKLYGKHIVYSDGGSLLAIARSLCTCGTFIPAVLANLYRFTKEPISSLISS